MVSLNTMLRILTGKIPRSYDRPHHQPCQGCFVLAIMHGAYVEFGFSLCAPDSWVLETKPMLDWIFFPSMLCVHDVVWHHMYV